MFSSKPPRDTLPPSAPRPRIVFTRHEVIATGLFVLTVASSFAIVAFGVWLLRQR